MSLEGEECITSRREKRSGLVYGGEDSVRHVGSNLNCRFEGIMERQNDVNKRRNITVIETCIRQRE